MTNRMPNQAAINRAAKTLYSRQARSPSIREPKSSARVSGQAGGLLGSAHLGEAIQKALLGYDQRPRVLNLGQAPEVTPVSGPVADEGNNVEPLLGSILQLQAVDPGWRAVLFDEESKDKWEEPVIGWAVVVTWVAYSEENEEESTKGTKQFQTEVQPLTLTKDGALEVPLFRDNTELVTIVQPGQVQI